MNTTHSAKAADRVKKQASNWFLRLQSPDVPSRELEAFGDWLTQNPQHEAEYFAVEELWSDLDAVADDLDIRAKRRRLSRQRQAMQRTRHRRKTLFAMAASVIVALGAGLFYLSDSAPAGSHYSTALGEQRVVALDDGSVITLDTLTSLTVYYTARERRIELHDGQANFKVEKDRARPFRVAAGPGVVQALGTRFDVYNAKRKITVTLLEGAIEVRSLGDGRQRREAGGVLATLQPGERVAYNRGGEIVAPLAKIDIKRASAWRNRRLDFDNTPLGDVVTEVNRYSPTKLELGDRSLAELTVSGVFDVDHTEELVKALQIHFKVRAVHGGVKRIVLLPGNDRG